MVVLLAMVMLVPTNLRAQNIPSDPCVNSGATNRFTVGATCTMVTFNKPNAFVANLTPPGNTCNSGAFDDAFGWFQATSTSTIITYAPAANDAVLHVFSGTCAAPVQVACADAGLAGVAETVTFTTTVGTNYFFRVQRWNSNAAMDGTICVYNAPPPPANDNPCGAVSLTVGTSCSYVNSTNAAATGSTGIPAPGCASYNGGDVWFSAVVPANGRLIIDSNTGTMTDGGMALYTTAPNNCSGTFTLVECDDDDSVNGDMPMIDRAGLAPGSTVWIRFWAYNNAGNGTFQICAYSPVPPANDNPCSPVALSVGTSCTYVNATTVAATGTTGVPDPGCASYNGGDVWFTAVVPAGGRLVINSNTGSMADGGMALYTTAPNNCSGTFTLVECDDDDSPNGFMPMIDRSGLTPGATVWIRFWAYNNVGNGTFQICAYAPVPPANDNPCGAINLPVNTTCTPISATNEFATATTGPPAPTCATYAGGDVWFRLTVPASGAVIIETFADGIDDGGMAVYTAPSCSGTFIQEYCDDDAGPGLMPYLSMTGLAPLSTIWVRFWAFNNYDVGTFTICAHTPPPPPTGDCVYALNLFDSAENGWGASNVGVRINGGPWTYYTVGGSNTQVLIGMMVGDFIELSYDASGPNQAQNSYTLGLWGGGTFFNSGNSPTAGPSFGQLVDCVPPPTAPQDCEGGFTVCSGQNFGDNSSNSGNVVDLNSSNRGCLSSGEQEGTWYYFSPSAGGTVSMNITPNMTTGSDTTDYDFAIWGPYSTVTCPPSAPPIRCSYAYPQTTPTYPSVTAWSTGLGNGAVDNSETAAGDGWVAPLLVTAGQIYVLYIDKFTLDGEGFNLSWQLSGGASLDCTLLPVELMNVSAKAMGRSVIVSWSTLSEDGSDRFIVERSVDGVFFEPIGSVPAAGYSSAPLDYRLHDASLGMGIWYYRINMVDYNGRSTLSPIVTATIDRWNSNLVLAPNPVSDVLNITFRTVPQDGVTMSIIDAAGRLVRDIRVTLPEGSALATISTQGLDAGSYTLAVFGMDGTPLSFAPFVRD